MKRLKSLRVIIAVISLVGITLFFLGFGSALKHQNPAISQLVPALLGGSLAVLAIWFVLSFLLGRVYCSFVCPLGILQDVLIRLTRRIKRRPFVPQTAHPCLQTTFILIFLLLVVLGFSASLASLIDPYGIFGRFLAHFVLPVRDVLMNFLADRLGVEGPVVLFKREVFLAGAGVLGVVVSSFLALSALVAWRGRVFCTTVCPVGAFLGWLARISPFRLAVDTSACVKCGRCTGVCKTGCLDGKAGTLDNSRCVRCFNCVSACPKDAVVWKGAWKGEVDSERRAAIVNLASFGAIYGLGSVLFPRSRDCAGQELPPPGARVGDLKLKCTACGLCMARCPKKIIVPAAFGDYGGMGFMMPKLDFSRGFCDPDCTVCGEVCPSGAISALSLVEKSAWRIGLAKWDEKKCLVCSEKVPCGLCARRCPHQAITLDKDGRPSVDAAKCMGCGACEHYCPTQALSVQNGDF